MAMHLILIYLQLVNLSPYLAKNFDFKVKGNTTYTGLIIIYGSVFILRQQMIVQTKISKSKLV